MIAYLKKELLADPGHVERIIAELSQVRRELRSLHLSLDSEVKELEKRENELRRLPTIIQTATCERTLYESPEAALKKFEKLQGERQARLESLRKELPVLRQDADVQHKAKEDRLETLLQKEQELIAERSKFVQIEITE